MMQTDWRLINEEPPDLEPERLCPLCGERLDYANRCPNWLEHMVEEQGINP